MKISRLNEAVLRTAYYLQQLDVMLPAAPAAFPSAMAAATASSALWPSIGVLKFGNRDLN